MYRFACAASLAAAVASPARASCGAAFCNVNTNWSIQGIWTEPGLHVDLRLEYIDQDQPMSGSRKVAVDGDGAVAERSLQPGTGTVQAAVTGYYRQTLSEYNASWYAQAGAQVPLDSYRGYRPGSQFALDLGYRYDVNDKLGLNLQLNYVYKARDSGSEAEPDDSGSQTLSIAPGLTYSVTPTVQLYAFVAAPLYRHVNGVQLTADWSVAGGISVQF